MTLRILLVHNVVAPYRLPVFDALADKYDLTVLFCTEGASERRWSTELGDRPFDHAVLPHVSVGGVRFNYTVLRHLVGQDFDAVLISDSADTIITSSIVATYARVFGIPYIVWTEVIEPSEGRQLSDTTHLGTLKGKSLKAIRRVLYRGASGFVAYSGRAKAYLLTEGVEEAEIASGIQVMPESIFAEPPEGSNVNTDELTVLYVGYLNDRKGVEYLIDAYRQVATETSRLVLVGTGPAEQRLRKHADGEEDIVFTGYVSEERKAAYYSSADVFVLPTLHDAWGLVINEAMHFGLPVIVTSAAGAAELVERHDNGYVVPPGNIDALAARLRELLEDQSLRDRLARRSMAASEVTDVSVAIDPFETAIERLREGHRRT